ncbi:hypothetical protein ACFE04_002186 [Oxalis oulophora]
MDSNLPPPTNNSTTIITIIIGPPPPPPFLPPPSPPRSIDLSALEFILALISIISIPALIYTFLFAIKCSPFNRSTHHNINNHRSSTLDQASDSTTTTTTSSSDFIITELPSNDGSVKFKREAHVKEMGTTECPVCLSVFLDGEDIRQLSACEHAFHSACIDMWLTSHSSCPICRALVVNNNRNKKLRSNNTYTDRRMSAVRYVYDDHHQGLPDASSLV